MSKITNDGLTQSDTGCYPHGISGCKGLILTALNLTTATNSAVHNMLIPVGATDTVYSNMLTTCSCKLHNCICHLQNVRNSSCTTPVTSASRDTVPKATNNKSHNNRLFTIQQNSHHNLHFNGHFPVKLVEPNQIGSGQLHVPREHTFRVRSSSLLWVNFYYNCRYTMR